MELRASSTDINVMIVIDTDYVKSHYPNPSQKSDNPTPIDHKSQFMVCTDPRGIISGQGTADLNFKALPGDNVSFRGTSIYGNSDDAVIVYGISPWNGVDVFNSFRTDKVERQGAAVPDINSPNGIPEKKIKADFISYDSKVQKKGTENFHVKFGLYTCNDGETQNLLGYYQWDPTITVQ